MIGMNKNTTSSTEEYIDQSNPASLIERTSILNAYYFPRVDGAELYSTASPVNSFRFILNFYFNQNLEILEDKTDINF